MKRIVLIITFISFLNAVKADLGLPTIQAICKITFNDGHELEGIISFGGGGYWYNYTPHGFCLKFNNGSYELIQFNFDFKRFSPNSYGSFRDKSAKLYFAKNQTPDQFNDSRFTFNDTSKILTKTKIVSNNFKLSDSIRIYKSLPISLFVEFPYNDKIDFVDVAVSDIASFELLENPSDFWINLINISIKLTNIRMAEDEKNDSPWIDYMMPVWYHNILKDKRLYDLLKPGFKE